MTYKNYILTKENGNKILLKKFLGIKFSGLVISFALFVFGFLLIFINLSHTDFSSVLDGIFLIFLSLLFAFSIIPLSIKIKEHKDKFLIEKTYSFWIKKNFEISKKENPIVLGVKHSRFLSESMILSNKLYELKLSYNENKDMKLNYPISTVGSPWNTPEEIKEIADFFELPFKL